MESARAATPSWPSLRRDLLTALLISGLAAFALVVLLLLTRRLTGGLVNPLGGISLVGVTGLGLMLVGAWRLGWQARSSRESSLSLVAPVLPGFSLFLLLSVLSLPGTVNWALMLTWLAFFTCEAAWWWAAYSANRQPAARRTTSQSVAAGPAAAEPEAEVAIETREETIASDVFQQITRIHDGEQERISALLRLSFSAGQRVAVAHLAFCPPLSEAPELEAEVTDGPDASVTLTNIQTYGLRLEVRLEESAEEACAVGVEVAGHGRNHVLGLGN